MPIPDDRLDGTAGELNQAGISWSRCPTKDPPSLPFTSFTTRDLFIPKDRRPPLPVASSSLMNSSLMTTAPPLRRNIPLLERVELPDSPPNLPPDSQTNDIQQVNARDVQLLSLVSSEAIADSQSYDILNVEEVENS